MGGVGPPAQRVSDGPAPHIVQAAAALINHNPNRLGKTLWTAQQKGV